MRWKWQIARIACVLAWATLAASAPFGCGGYGVADLQGRYGYGTPAAPGGYGGGYGGYGGYGYGYGSLASNPSGEQAVRCFGEKCARVLFE